MPRPSPDERKATILDAVLKSIIDVGFTAMTVADVAKVAGVSTALVHYHFDSKTELILAALRRACDDDKQLRESVVAAGGTALARIDRVLCGSLPRERTDASWLLWIETWGETRREPALRAVMDDLNHHEQRIILGLLAEGGRNGEFAPLTGPQAAAATDRLMAARDGLAIQHTLFGAKARRSHFRDLLRGAIRHQLELTGDRYDDLLGAPVRAAG